MKIVLVGIYYPVAILRYFEAALRRNKDVELFTAGPYTGNWIPWNNGMWLKNIPQAVDKPDLELPREVPIPFAFVEAKLPWVPDLWLQVDAGYHLQGKPKHGTVFTIGTDPHCLNYDEVRVQSDLFFCMQHCYKKESDIWLPYAYDPIWHDSQPLRWDNVTINHDFDSMLVGMTYDNRKLLHSKLIASGVKDHLENGPAYLDARELYWRAKIGWNWSSLQDLTARVFEVMAMGLCPIANHVPDMDRMGWAEGREYLSFTSVPSAIEKFKWALQGDNWRDVSDRAYKAVLPHTYDARIKQVLGELK